MKVKIKEEHYNQLLSEGKQVGELYHFTNLNSAISIVKNDKLKADRLNSDKLDKILKPETRSTISFTRDRNFLNRRVSKGDYPQIGGFNVIFVVDGDMLANNYRTMPYDDRISLTHSIGDEMEQIFYGTRIEKDRGIKNFKKYVKKIILNKLVVGTEDKEDIIKAYRFFRQQGYKVELEGKNEESVEKNIKYYMNLFKIKNYKIREDGKVDVYESVVMDEKYLKKIPVPFGLVQGHFSCRINELKSLENAPEEVTGDFNCSSNRLTNLDFSPKKVGEDFIANQNYQLKDIEGISKEIGGNLHIRVDSTITVEYIRSLSDIKGNIVTY